MRQRQRAVLQELLQARLRILGERRGLQARETRPVERHEYRARSLESAVEVDRAEHRLERIGERRATPKAARAQLAGTEPEPLREAEAIGDVGEGFAIDEVGPVAA